MQQLSLIRLDFASPLVPGRSSIVPGGPKEFKVPVSGLKEGKIGALDLSAPRQTFSGACHALLPNVTVVRSSALEKSMLKVSILLLSRAPLSQKSKFLSGLLMEKDSKKFEASGLQRPLFRTLCSEEYLYFVKLFLSTGSKIKVAFLSSSKSF